MTEPSDTRSIGQYDSAMGALSEHADTLPAVAVFDATSSTSTLSDDSVAVGAACQAKGVAVVVLAPNAALRKELENTLLAAGSKARVLVPGDEGSSSGVTAALRDLKASTGISFEQMAAFSSDGPTLREAARLGATTARLAPSARGVDAAALRRGLEAHASKIADSRGY